MILGIKRNIYIIGGGFNPFKVVRLIAHRRNYYYIRHYRCRKAVFFVSRIRSNPFRTFCPWHKRPSCLALNGSNPFLPYLTLREAMKIEHKIYKKIIENRVRTYGRFERILIYAFKNPSPLTRRGVCISTTFCSRIAQGLRTHSSRFQIILIAPQTLCLIETWTLIRLIF
jgi:hypothetical protein